MVQIRQELAGIRQRMSSELSEPFYVGLCPNKQGILCLDECRERLQATEAIRRDGFLQLDGRTSGRVSVPWQVASH